MHPLSVVLLRGVELAQVPRILEQFPATRVIDTWEAQTWPEAALALRRGALAACCIGRWLVLVDPEARLAAETTVLERITRRYETTVIGLISDRERDSHKLEYHSKERQRSFLCSDGRFLEETGTPLFQEAELADLAWDYAKMSKLMARLAVNPSLVRSGGPFVLMKLFELTADRRFAGFDPEFPSQDEEQDSEF